jgi:hypothetical protein
LVIPYAGNAARMGASQQTSALGKAGPLRFQGKLK